MFLLIFTIIAFYYLTSRSLSSLVHRGAAGGKGDAEGDIPDVVREKKGGRYEE